MSSNTYRYNDCQRRGKWNEYLYSSINDYNLYKKDRNLLTQLKPLSERLNILQKDFVTVANSYMIRMTSLKKRHSNRIINLLEKESGFEAIPLLSITQASSI